ncbi:MAG: hypothetical protein EAZ24_12900, partial [Burkholderiales bacterium]
MRNSNRIAVALSGLVTALLVAGCAVGPTHLAPAESVIAATAPQWQAGTALAKPQLENVRATEFWARWNDPSLQSLIDSAMTSAASVEAAQARIAQARAGVGV